MRDYREKFPKQKKTKAILQILSKKFVENKVVLLNNFEMTKISTKEAFDGFDKVIKASSFEKEYFEKRKTRKNTNDKRRNITLILNKDNVTEKKSTRNIPWLKMVNLNRLAALPLFYNHGLIITREAFDKLTENLGD